MQNAKINLKVFHSPPYEHELWHYQCSNVDLIQRAIEQFSWKNSFRILHVNEMVFLFNKTFNIFLQTLFLTRSTLDQQQHQAAN